MQCNILIDQAAIQGIRDYLVVKQEVKQSSTLEPTASTSSKQNLRNLCLILLSLIEKDNKYI